MKICMCLVVLTSLVAGCAGKPPVPVGELTTTLGRTTELSKDRLWSAALESFSLDQMGVRGTLGLVPRRIPVNLQDAESEGRELSTNWYEADKAAGTIGTRWLDIPSAAQARYCDCPEDTTPGMTTTSVKLNVLVKALENGSSLDLESAFQRFKDTPLEKGSGKTTVCTSRGILEGELFQMILDRAAGKK